MGEQFSKRCTFFQGACFKGGGGGGSSFPGKCCSFSGGAYLSPFENQINLYNEQDEQGGRLHKVLHLVTFVYLIQ